MVSPVVLLRKIGLYLAGAAIVFVFFAPLYLMVITSLKDDEQEPLRSSLFVVGGFSIDHYATILKSSDDTNRRGRAWFSRTLWRSARASFAYSGLTILATLTTASMAGYVLAKRQFRGSRTILFILLLSALIPEALTVFPNISLITRLGLRGKFWGLVLPRMASPLAILICWRAMAAIPNEFIESARLDTDSEWKLFSKVVLPLSRPTLAALGVVFFVWSWNETLWPLFMRFSRDERLISTIAPSLFWFLRSSSWGDIMAVVVIISFPALVFYILFYEKLNDTLVSEGAKVLKPLVSR